MANNRQVPKTVFVQMTAIDWENQEAVAVYTSKAAADAALTGEASNDWVVEVPLYD